MKDIFLFLLVIFPYTNQLSCFHQCISIKIQSSESFREASDVHKCSNDTQAIKCYGQLLVYYERSDHLQYISYSLGPRKHVIEQEIEAFVEKNHFKAVLYYYFMIDSFQTDEVILSIYIICQTDDNCALNYIRDLFHSYQKKTNPSSQLKPLLYNSQEVSTLICYNSDTKHIEECSISQHSTCMINNTDILEQKCSFDSNTKLEYGFMIISSEKTSIKPRFELVVCSIAGCNDELVFNQVKDIVYNYTLSGLNMTFSHSNKLNFAVFDWIYLLTLSYIFSG